MSQPNYDIDENEIDDLHADLDEEERRRPGSRATVDRLTEIMRVTTALWRQREAVGLSEEEVAERGGLSIEEVELVEDNAVDVSFDVLRRYATAVGLQFDLHQIPA
jgi:phosphate uptake regulator